MGSQKEIYVIERMISPGIWELFAKVAYFDKRSAVNECYDIIKKMQEINGNFAARVTKLQLK